MQNQSDQNKRRNSGAFVGGAGHWLLHLVEILFLVYSAYHGINATTTYRAAAGLGNLAGILGIVAIEVTLLAIYLAWVNHKLSGVPQQIAAGVTYAIGFIFACLGIIGDSQLQAGIPPAPWLSVYLMIVLPAAPAIMALGGFLIVMIGPESMRRRNEAEDEQDILENEHDIRMKLRFAQAQADAQLKALELDTKLALAAQMKQYAASPDAQRAIVATAERDGPALLRAIGIFVEEPPRPAAPPDTTGGQLYAAPRPAAPAPNGNGQAGNGHH